MKSVNAGTLTTSTGTLSLDVMSVAGLEIGLMFHMDVIVLTVGMIIAL
jgi:hypothetical protein